MKKNILFALLTIFTGTLYSQKLVPTDKLALLSGIVTNFKAKPLSKEVVMLVNDKTKAVVTITTDVAGKFEVLVPVDAAYVIKYKSFTSDVEYTKMTVPADKEASYNVQIRIDPPKEFVLENVYFDTGKSTLKPNSNKALNDLVEVLKLKTVMVIEIQGHTDNVGKEEENLKLSQARADEVRKYLLAKGIGKERVSAKGYGQSSPVADNATDAGKAKNRRTSLKVIKE